MKTKRGQGEGTFRRLPSGAWEYRFRVPGDNGFTVRKSVTGETKTEARARADVIRKAAESGQVVTTVRKVPTVGEWASAWVRDVLPHSGVGTSTRNLYASLITSHVTGSKLGRVKVTEVRPTALQGLVGEAMRKDGKPLSASSRRSLHAALTACFEAAVSDRLIGENPMRRAKRPKNPNPGRSAEARAFTDDQVVAILAATSGHRHDALVRTAFLTGMRRGELLGLTWADVDLDARSIRVERQVTVDDDDVVDPKTNAGRRVIPISDDLVAVLSAHRVAEDVRRARLSDADPDVVFADRHGRALDPRSISRWFDGVVDASGITDERTVSAGLHACRHTAVSRWLVAGVPITVASKWAGHASPEITLRIYSWCVVDDDSVYADLVTLPVISHNISHLPSRTVVDEGSMSSPVLTETAV